MLTNIYITTNYISHFAWWFSYYEIIEINTQLYATESSMEFILSYEWLRFA